MLQLYQSRCQACTLDDEDEGDETYSKGNYFAHTYSEQAREVNRQGSAQRREDPTILESNESVKQDQSEMTMGKQSGRWFEALIGQVECRWKTLSNEVAAMSFGTACAIDSDIILTCAHNIYCEKQRMLCDEILFYPGKRRSSEVYTAVQKSIAFEKLGFFEKYSQRPLPKDFALVKLKQKLPLARFPKLTSRALIEGEEIEIMGYPRNRAQQFERVDLKGVVFETKDHIIVHTMPTENGHSGSPIICQTMVDGEINYEICGIHTHRGPLNYNQGVAITEKIEGKVNFLLKTLRERYPNPNPP